MPPLRELPPIPTTESPQHLNDARNLVLNLPGVDQYVPDRATAPGEIDHQLDIMIMELTLQLDAENMGPLITNNLGWSHAQAKEFFAHPDRQPYQSRLRLSLEPVERMEQLITIGRYLVHRYQEAKVVAQPDQLRQTQGNLRIFFEYSLYNIFSPYVFDQNDQYSGIDPEDRRNGAIQPTDEIRELIQNEARQVARTHRVDAEKLYRDVLNATEGGNFNTIITYLWNNKGESVLRRALEAILAKRGRDRQITDETLKLLWTAEAFRLSMGIDLEMYLELGEFPNIATVQRRIDQFLTNPDYVEETFAHLKREAPSVFNAYDGSDDLMNIYAILEARAHFHGFPDVPSSPEALEEKKRRVLDTVRNIFPLAFTDTPLSYIDAPLSIGATRRPVNITYRNSNNKIVNVVALNVRTDETNFGAAAGHELTHKLHASLLTKAEDAGYVPAGSNERVPASIKEEFSQLVEGQIAQLFQKAGEDSLRHKQAQGPGGEFRDLSHAIIERRQGPYALIQLAVRQELEMIWNSGKRTPLTLDDINGLLDEYQAQTIRWYARGVPIVFPYHRVDNNVSILAPDDGLVYLGKYIVDSTRPTDSETAKPDEAQGVALDMKTAFEQRFGKQWVLNRDARTILLALLAESGNNTDITTYGTFILEANIEQLEQRLKTWEIATEMI